ncbi:MAG: DUF4191 domain-containing protein [Actinomycetota bacterium]|nr:DUF4191 domain-containing protein [Actinomycetota bacterium]
MAKSTDPNQLSRRKQIAQAYRMTRQHDRRIGWVLLAVFLLAALVFGGLFWWLIHPIAGVLVGIPAGVLAAMVVFGRRAERSAYAQMEGQPGAAAAALAMLRRGWDVKPAVAFTKNQDVVHRVVGRPGIVLIGEGDPTRVRNLLAVEKKKHARVAGEAPLYDLVVGDGSDDTVAIKKLPRRVMKLPRNLRPAEVTDLLQRLRALDATRPQVPMPKGPMPQNARAAQRAARQAMRGR